LESYDPGGDFALGPLRTAAAAAAGVAGCVPIAVVAVAAADEEGRVPCGCAAAELVLSAPLGNPAVPTLPAEERTTFEAPEGVAGE
jgi:hypothetical protein